MGPTVCQGPTTDARWSRIGIESSPKDPPQGQSPPELVGDDGREIAQFMFDVMTNEKACTADRVDAGRWLADRAFGRSVQPVDLDVSQHPLLDLRGFATEDLEALLEILDKYPADAHEIVESGELGIGRSELEGSSSRQR
jgi:hypothetical protein